MQVVNLRSTLQRIGHGIAPAICDRLVALVHVRVVDQRFPQAGRARRVVGHPNPTGRR